MFEDSDHYWKYNVLKGTIDRCHAIEPGNEGGKEGRKEGEGKGREGKGRAMKGGHSITLVNVT